MIRFSIRVIAFTRWQDQNEWILNWKFEKNFKFESEETREVFYSTYGVRVCVGVSIPLKITISLPRSPPTYDQPECAVR